MNGIYWGYITHLLTMFITPFTSKKLGYNPLILTFHPSTSRSRDKLIPEMAHGLHGPWAWKNQRSRCSCDWRNPSESVPGWSRPVTWCVWKGWRVSWATGWWFISTHLVALDWWIFVDAPAKTNESRLFPWKKGGTGRRSFTFLKYDQW